MLDKKLVRFKLDSVAVPGGAVWESTTHILGEVGIQCPARGLYRPCIDPFWVGVDEREILIFGRRGSLYGIGIDIEGRVVSVFEHQCYHHVSFVNSSIVHFNDSVSWFSRRFPIHGHGMGIGDFDLEAEELKNALSDIDSPCLGPDTFWDSIYWDVVFGEWCSEEIEDEETDWTLFRFEPPDWWDSRDEWLSPSFEGYRSTPSFG